MERDDLSRRDFFRNAAAGAAGLAGVALAVSSVASGIEAMVKDSSNPEQPSLEPVVPSNDPGSEVSIPSTSRRVNRVQERQEQIVREMTRIEKIMEANPNVFTKKKIKDFSMYYPIYRPISDKFQIDWYLIFIVHEAETGASAGTRGFLESSYYKGAMQLDPESWSQQYIENASKGLTYLANLPQRHADDWMNIAAGAKILADDFHAHKNFTKDQAVLFALRRYSSREQADKRFKTYQKYESLFAPKKKVTVPRQALMAS